MHNYNKGRGSDRLQRKLTKCALVTHDSRSKSNITSPSKVRVQYNDYELRNPCENQSIGEITRLRKIVRKNALNVTLLQPSNHIRHTPSGCDSSCALWKSKTGLTRSLAAPIDGVRVFEWFGAIKCPLGYKLSIIKTTWFWRSWTLSLPHPYSSNQCR